MRWLGARGTFLAGDRHHTLRVAFAAYDHSPLHQVEVADHVAGSPRVNDRPAVLDTLAARAAAARCQHERGGWYRK